MLEKFGVTRDDLQQIKPESVSGRTLILDGDGPCYAVTAKCAKLSTAYNRMERHVLERMFLTGSEQARVHLTPTNNLKNKRDYYLGEKFYQGNRLNKEKPQLLELLRSTLADHFQDHDTIKFIAHTAIEADDAIMQDCYTIPNIIVESADKDLNIVPVMKYDPELGKFNTIDNRYGWVALKYTESGKPKPSGHGTAFFWAQLLMGDAADNIKGIKTYNGKLCGIAGAMEIIGAIGEEDDAANAVLDGYRAINQNILPEAECLWLTRVHGDSAFNYINSLGLSEANREYLINCYSRKHFMTEDEYITWQDIYAGCNSTAQVTAQWNIWRKRLGL